MKTFTQLKEEWDLATGHLTPSEFIAEFKACVDELKPQRKPMGLTNVVVKKFQLSKDVNIGFSCGKDSIALAHYFKNKRYNVKLIHVYNGLPGDDLIKEKARRFALDFNYSIDVVPSIPYEGNLENECRNARIRAFSFYKYAKILVAHHLGDCVENYLRNCFSGHPEHQPMTFMTPFRYHAIMRPFLMVRPAEIEEYIDKNNLRSYIAEDQLTPKSRRHWMRTKLLPVINENYQLESVVLQILKRQFNVFKF